MSPKGQERVWAPATQPTVTHQRLWPTAVKGALQQAGVGLGLALSPGKSFPRFADSGQTCVGTGGPAPHHLPAAPWGLTVAGKQVPWEYLPMASSTAFSGTE